MGTANIDTEGDMPDLIREAFWKCDTEHRLDIQSESDPNKTYHVVVKGFNAHCDCPAFKYRNDCKHVTKAFDTVCEWNDYWNSRGLKVAEDASGNPCCPMCGGPVSVFYDMV